MMDYYHFAEPQPDAWRRLQAEVRNGRSAIRQPQRLSPLRILRGITLGVAIAAAGLMLLSLVGCSKSPSRPCPCPGPGPSPAPAPSQNGFELLCFSEPWCSACQAEKKRENQFALKHAADVEMIHVSADAKTERIEGITYKGTCETDVTGIPARSLYQRYGITCVPSYVLRRAHAGAEVARWTGGGHWIEIDAAVNR